MTETTFTTFPVECPCGIFYTEQEFLALPIVGADQAHVKAGETHWLLRQRACMCGEVTITARMLVDRQPAPMGASMEERMAPDQGTKVKLGKEDLDKRKDQLVAVDRDLQDAAAEKSEAMAEHNKTLKDLRAKQRALLETIQTGFEIQDRQGNLFQPPIDAPAVLEPDEDDDSEDGDEFDAAAAKAKPRKKTAAKSTKKRGARK